MKIWWADHYPNGTWDAQAKGGTWPQPHRASGGPGGTRTPDPSHVTGTLSQLSYGAIDRETTDHAEHAVELSHITYRIMRPGPAKQPDPVAPPGIEPGTFRV